MEQEVHEITTCEALTLLDKLVNLKELNKDERASLSSIKERLEIIRVKTKSNGQLRTSLSKKYFLRNFVLVIIFDIC